MGGDVLFAKTDEMSVLFYANLPLEVKQVLRTSGAVTRVEQYLGNLPPVADFNKDQYSGEIDTVTGFALVASAQSCFVWQHSQVCFELYIQSAMF
jgi:nuclear pore complex protein Nup133